MQKIKLSILHLTFFSIPLTVLLIFLARCFIAITAACVIAYVILVTDLLLSDWSQKIQNLSQCQKQKENIKDSRPTQPVLLLVLRLDAPIICFFFFLNSAPGVLDPFL